MALKAIEVPKRDFNPGDTHEGYLLAKDTNEMQSDERPGEFNKRPMLTLQDKVTNEVFKIFLGSTSMDVLPLLTVGAFTKCVKSKDKTMTTKTRGYFQYTVAQDLEDTIGKE